MGILVWVLGPGRAVPINYRSLVLNEALINWFNPSSNYNDVVSAAADEAGHHGFVTELATGDPDDDNSYAQSIFFTGEQAARNRLDGLGVQDLLLEASSYFGTWDGYREVLEQSVTLRPGYTVDEFLQCVDCYFGITSDAGASPSQVAPDASPNASMDAGLMTPDADPIWATDTENFLMLLDTLVIDPMSDTAALFPGNSVTRLYTTLSADEMTEDPAFDFNPSLPALSNIHTADQYRYCDGSWVITLPSGLTIQGDGFSWPISTEDGLPYNQQVIQDDVSGPGEVITDNLALIESALGSLGVLGEPMVVGADADAGSDQHITYVDDNGCGCRVAGRRASDGTVWWMAALGAGFLARRRRIA
jgi:MYXO-CTERM domain-containing protein